MALPTRASDARITDVPADILAADGVVLPGVGAFTDAMTTMEETEQADALRTTVADGVPFLGICLGMHLLFDWGDEGQPRGAAWQDWASCPVTWSAWLQLTRGASNTRFRTWVGTRSSSSTILQGVRMSRASSMASRMAATSTSYCAVPDDAADLVATSEACAAFRVRGRARQRVRRAVSSRKVLSPGLTAPRELRQDR